MDWDAKPSVFNPLLRRLFGNEAQREQRETFELYASLKGRDPHMPEEIVSGVYHYFSNVPDDLLNPMRDAVEAVVRQERYAFELPAPGALTLAEFADYRNFLRRKEYYLAHHAELTRLMHECLVRIFCAIAEDLPQTADQSPFTIPLIYATPAPGTLITQLFNTLVEDQYYDRLIFRTLADRLALNVYSASGIEPGAKGKKLKHACDSGLPLDQLNNQYLSGTPFHALFKTSVPLKFTHEDRFNHMHVVGGTGAGKTTLLQNLMLFDLESENPPALVVIDGQGDLIGKLSRLALFDPERGRLRDRLILITPKDIRHPPALNIFDVNRDRLGGYDEVTKEQVVAGVIQTFDYLFAGLLGADLTAKQSVFFRFVARLMLALPETMGRNATILDMIALMDDPAPYREAIRSLPPIQRNFFERDFLDPKNSTFKQTKEQIRYRLNAILENPTLARLFTAPKTKVDLFEELNRGSIILVDTAKDFLKDASSNFGRIFISLVLQSVLERAAIPEQNRRDTFLIVDEAASYFDSNIDDLLTEARKFKCGCVFAHQFLDQATPQLKSSLAANTGIKFAGGVSMNDARALAADMRTTPDFILSQPRLHFAAHIRHTTPSAVSIPIEVGRLETEPTMAQETYERFRELNRAKVSIPMEAAPEAPYGASGQRVEPKMDQGRDPHTVVREASRTSTDPSAASEDW